MRLIICRDYAHLSGWTARYIAKRIREAANRERPFVLGLPTGSSPLGTYRELIDLRRKGELSFSRVITFNMDEYLGLPAGHPQSYRRFMDDNFFHAIDIDPKNTHVPDGTAPDPEAECRAYEEAIAASGGVDLFLGGMGSDGHIAFNEPGSSLRSRTRIKTLTTETRIANARFFGGDPEQVPPTALTVGIGTIMDARELLIIASGHAKARALKAAVEGSVSHWWPLSCLQMHPKALIVCDEEALDELKVATVRYFKALEGPALEGPNLAGET
ncbi:MAG: glucosamine-6-phosphate deaminase [Treponema sp.]|jgi:glucosamine-6-phosphate deaminase|nr:glucosamine-6-phosphate deaminase [Treponema sp.]